jgi:hypothetical protein
VELVRIIGFKKDVVMVEFEAGAAALDTPSQCGECTALPWARAHRSCGFLSELSGSQGISVTVKDHNISG